MKINFILNSVFQLSLNSTWMYTWEREKERERDRERLWNYRKYWDKIPGLKKWQLGSFLSPFLIQMELDLHAITTIMRSILMIPAVWRPEWTVPKALARVVMEDTVLAPTTHTVIPLSIMHLHKWCLLSHYVTSKLSKVLKQDER